MNPTTLRAIIFLVIMVHGIGHSQGVLVALGLFTTDTWHSQSWLFGKFLGENANRILGLVLWSACFIGFIATGLAILDILVPHEYWRNLAIVFAGVSLFSVFTYWNSLSALFNKVGAIGVNLAILIGLLILNWPTEADIGY